jgi:hypothetical protein
MNLAIFAPGEHSVAFVSEGHLAAGRTAKKFISSPDRSSMKGVVVANRSSEP